MNWKVLIALFVGAVIVGLDITAVNLALPSIAHHFSSVLSQVKWVLTAYFICSGSLILLMARVGDHYSHKFIYLVGLLVFAAFSFLSGISQSLDSLIFFRVCQGVGLACVYPALYALAIKTHEKSNQWRALRWLTAFAVLGFGTGPFVGGWILSTIGWPWIFFLSAAVALLAFIIGIFCTEEGTEPNELDQFSYLSGTLLTTGLAIFLFAFNHMIDWKPYSIEFIGCIILALLLIFFMGVRELQAKHPFVNINYLIKPAYICAMCVRASAQFLTFGSFLVLSLFLQNILLFTPFGAGLILLFFSGALVLLSFLCGPIFQKAQLKPFLFFIVAMGTIGAILLGLYCFVPALIFIYCGLGFVALSALPSAILFMKVSFKQFPKCSTGSVFGLIFSWAIVAGSLGTTLTSYVLNHASSTRLAKLLSQSQITLLSDQLNLVKSVASGGNSLRDLSSLGSLASKIKPLVLDSFYTAYVWVFGVYLMILVIGWIGAIFYQEIEETDEHTSPHESSAEINQ